MSGALAPYRQVAVEVCIRLGLTPVYMEEFDPQLTPEQVSRRTVESSDVFVMLLGHRYGARPPGGELSYTELEYRWAAERPEMPVLAFVVDPDFPWPPGDIDHGANAQALARFVAQVRTRHTVRPLAGVPTFREDLLIALSRLSDALSAPTQRKPAVFFSYARVDAPVVEFFAEELRSRGVSLRHSALALNLAAAEFCMAVSWGFPDSFLVAAEAVVHLTGAGPARAR